MSLSTAASDVKYFYDDANGNPVDVTDILLTCSEFGVGNEVLITKPYGKKMPVARPNGNGKYPMIDGSGLFETGDDKADALWGGRAPEGPTAATRTFTYQWLNGRTQSVETHLDDYRIQPNRENGLTRFSVKLQPTGDVTETGI